MFANLTSLYTQGNHSKAYRQAEPKEAHSPTLKGKTVREKTAKKEEHLGQEIEQLENCFLDAVEGKICKVMAEEGFYHE